MIPLEGDIIGLGQIGQLTVRDSKYILMVREFIRLNKPIEKARKVPDDPVSIRISLLEVDD